MLETIVLLVIALLIVMPVVAILLMAAQRIGGFEWRPQVLAIATLLISGGLLLVYAVAR